MPPNSRSGFDVSYVAFLDADAIGPLVAALPELQPALRNEIVHALRSRGSPIVGDHWQDWSLARQVAADAIERLRR